MSGNFCLMWCSVTVTEHRCQTGGTSVVWDPPPQVIQCGGAFHCLCKPLPSIVCGSPFLPLSVGAPPFHCVGAPPSLPADILEPWELELVSLDTAVSLKPLFLCSCDACLFIRLQFGQSASPWYNPMYVHQEIKLLLLLYQVWLLVFAIWLI